MTWYYALIIIIAILCFTYYKLACKHSFDESYDKEGYQHCVKCGKIFPIPCKHEYKIEEKHKFSSYISYTSRCKHCGDIKFHKHDTYGSGHGGIC